MNRNENKNALLNTTKPDIKAEAFLHNPAGIRELLQSRHALDFYPYRSGLFPASALSTEMGEVTGMGMAWLRDSCHIANSLWQKGDTESAVGAAKAVLKVFENSREKMEGVVSGQLDPKDPANRPPVRVDSETLTFTGDSWPNIQNDSVGYSLWLTSRLIKEGDLEPSDSDIDTLALMTKYLGAIRYWEDADSGHWEEARKLNASSIGTVVAGLTAAQEMFASRNYDHSFLQIPELIEHGKQSLQDILPYETPDHGENERRYDSALLFLVEPLNVVNPEQARKIVDDISEHLVRDIGVARYPKDSYWCPDFRDEFQLGERAEYAPGRLEQRDSLAQQGDEAQWTIFDPLLSVYWGKEFRRSGDKNARARQMWHLNRSLGQFVSGGPDGQSLLLPEAYFLERGEWVPNDHIPLLWAQANLSLALDMFEKTSV